MSIFNSHHTNIFIFLGFDGHLVMNEMEGWDDYHIIPKNSEKVTGITLTKHIQAPPSAIDLYDRKDEIDEEEKLETDSKINFIFKDTMTFIGGSLDRNTQKLTESKHEFRYLQQSELCKTDGKLDKNKFALLLKKGIYPYDHIQSHQDLAKESFPDKKYFHSSLGVGRDISYKDWVHGLNVWETFECKSMLDYR